MLFDKTYYTASGEYKSTESSLKVHAVAGFVFPVEPNPNMLAVTHLGTWFVHNLCKSQVVPDIPVTLTITLFNNS